MLEINTLDKLEFSESEIKCLCSSIEALETLITYHDIQIDQAESCMEDLTWLTPTVNFHKNRINFLKAHIQKLHDDM